MLSLITLSLLSLATAHERRSLGGLHDGAAALARRATLRSELAATPALTRSGGGACNLTRSAGGYWEACGGAAGNLGSFTGLALASAQAVCCANASCAGFSFKWTSRRAVASAGTTWGDDDASDAEHRALPPPPRDDSAAAAEGLQLFEFDM